MSEPNKHGLIIPPCRHGAAIRRAFHIGHRLGREWTEKNVAEFVQRMNQEVAAARSELEARLALARVQHEQDLAELRAEFRAAAAELGLRSPDDATLH